MFDIKENLKKLPTCPGVYLHKDKLGQVIYVGKAVSLKNRVSQYFQQSRNRDPKVAAMVSHIEEFEYITCATEMEALILECNLIKKYMPKYNILLRDDKTYPYIKVTVNEDFPRLFKTRQLDRDGAKYYGPYSDAGAVNQIVDFLNDICVLKRCSARRFPEGFRPCLNFHIGKCKGVCGGHISKEKYAENLRGALEFLNGREKPLLDYLTAEMQAAAETMEFEKAAEYRDLITAARALGEKQRVTILGASDFDIVLTAKSAAASYAVIFFVRDGKLSGREAFPMQADETDEAGELASAFIKQYYGEQGVLPREILLAAALPDAELTEKYLSELRGSQVKIFVPQRGDKKALLDLARRDLVELVKTIDEREKNRRERSQSLQSEIKKLLTLWAGDQRALDSAAETAPLAETAELAETAPFPHESGEYRMEAYDISNTNGVDTVGAMVVFVGARPLKKAYRRFKVHTEGPDDYASLQEVLYRRLKRAAEGDAGFATLPDVFLMDGGKGQVSAAEQVLSAFAQAEKARPPEERILKRKIPVWGMAKDDHHRTRALIWKQGEEFREIELRERPLLFKYMGTVQEEVHRFAIEYHHGLRAKSVQGSLLDNIPGIGPVKRNALLAHFGSIDNIKKAGEEELAMVDGITEKLAENIYKFFH